MRVGALWLASCAAMRPPGHLDAGVESIRLESYPGPFCGPCDTVTITAWSSGDVWIERGHWAGDYRNWVPERSHVVVPPERFAALRDQLRPYRPTGEALFMGAPPCATHEHHSAGIDVEWRRSLGTDHLVFDLSCERDIDPTRVTALATAHRALAIDGLRMPWEPPPDP